MKEQFVPYEQALELKELGFDEECFKMWLGKDTLRNEGFKNSTKGLSNRVCSAPLWQQAFDWFADRFDLLGVVDISKNLYCYKIQNLRSFGNEITADGYTYDNAR